MKSADEPNWQEFKQLFLEQLFELISCSKAIAMSLPDGTRAAIPLYAMLSREAEVMAVVRSVDGAVVER
ncbi:hypothetical protein TNCV_592661 [Trichonephila clavipes]|nr:hypothetical protein TNCV_592661 [Trichonephila clavipes]